jgi:hypothetical protein
MDTLKTNVLYYGDEVIHRKQYGDTISTKRGIKG